MTTSEYISEINTSHLITIEDLNRRYPNLQTSEISVQHLGGSVVVSDYKVSVTENEYFYISCFSGNPVIWNEEMVGYMRARESQ